MTTSTFYKKNYKIIYAYRYVHQQKPNSISFGGQITLWQADVFAYICQVTLSNGAVSPNTQHNTIKLMTPSVSRHNFQTQPQQNKPKTPDCKRYIT